MTDTANPVCIQKIGHVGLYCRDLSKMIDFYTRILGFKISDVNEKGMTFLRHGADHHSLVLAKMDEAEQKKGAGAKVVQQIALEVADLDAVKRAASISSRRACTCTGRSSTKGRAATTRSISTIPRATGFSSSATWTRSAGTARAGRRSNGSATRSMTRPE
jgi:predicted enzyme related to lactoylglutathione lyase